MSISIFSPVRLRYLFDHTMVSRRLSRGTRSRACVRGGRGVRNERSTVLKSSLTLYLELDVQLYDVDDDVKLSRLGLTDPSCQDPGAPKLDLPLPLSRQAKAQGRSRCVVCRVDDQDQDHAWLAPPSKLHPHPARGVGLLRALVDLRGSLLISSSLLMRDG